MNKTPKLDSISASDMEDGMFSGLLWRPENGFVWRDGMEVTSLNDDPDPRRTAASDPGPWLVTQAGGAFRYSVMRRSSVLDELVRLGRAPTAERIMQVAKKFGPLTKQEVLAPVGGGEVCSGVSLATWQRETQSLAALWELWLAVQREDAGFIGRFIRWDEPKVAVMEQGSIKMQRDQQVWVSLIECGLEPRPFVRSWLSQRDGGEFSTVARPSQRLASVIHDPQDLMRHWRRGDLIGPMNYYVHKRVNDALRGNVHMVVQPFLGSRIRYMPATLLAAAYVQFALRLNGGRRAERNCEYSDCLVKRFRPRRSNHTYCSKACKELAGYHRRKVTVGLLASPR